jgi:hypothetical protein
LRYLVLQERRGHPHRGQAPYSGRGNHTGAVVGFTAIFDAFQLKARLKTLGLTESVDVVCALCKSADDADSDGQDGTIIICDSCHLGYHCKCLRESAPDLDNTDAEWTCARCNGM